MFSKYICVLWSNFYNIHIFKVPVSYEESHMPSGCRMNKQSGLYEISRSGQLILSFYPLRLLCTLENPISSSQIIVPDLTCRHRIRRKEENYFTVPLQSPLSGNSKYNKHKLNSETCLSKTIANSRTTDITHGKKIIMKQMYWLLMNWSVIHTKKSKDTLCSSFGHANCTDSSELQKALVSPSISSPFNQNLLYLVYFTLDS